MMDHNQATTLKVEAQDSCVFELDAAFEGVGTTTRQPHFPPVARRALMAAVNTTSRELGLRSTSVVVLDALLSCLPCNDSKTGKEAPITPLTLLTVFACNETLCFRAKGISDRQLRRHLEKLEELNLIRRRDSANGKRFPIMRKGKVIGAFGIDLSPLLARSTDILNHSQKHREDADEIRGLKSVIYKLGNQCLSHNVDAEAQRFVTAARNVVRRTATTLQEARAMVERLKALMNGAVEAQHASPCQTLATVNLSVEQMEETPEPTSTSAERSGTDGQDVRHKETQKSYTKELLPSSVAQLWAKLTTIPAFYPEPPSSEHGLLQLLFEFGKMLRIKDTLLARAVSTLGIASALSVADQIAEKPDLVKCPDHYLSKIISVGPGSRVGHGQLSFAGQAPRSASYA